MKFREFKQSLKVCNEKCEDYLVTKRKLIHILHLFLYKHDFKFTHEVFSNYNNLYSVETKVFLKNSLIITQFGKGFSKLAALVSSYAEIIERIQLLYGFFSHNPFKPTLNFPFFNNSEINNKDVLLNQRFNTQIKENNPYLFKWESSRNKWIKVLDILKNEERLLLYRFLHNPSGTASGNTYEEAFVQGLCEIFERYCVGKVLLNQNLCPTIPIDVFNRKSQEYIRLLESDGIRIIIKDFSLNKGFPTIGLLCDFAKRKEMKPSFFRGKRFHLQVGSATSMDYALQRAISELFQVIGHIKLFSIEEEAHQKRISKIYRIFPHLNKLIPENAFHCLMFIKKSFISDVYLESLVNDVGAYRTWSYHDNLDCYIEVKNLLNLLKKNNYHVYMMDYSWLDFPTLLIIVPELHLGYNEILYESSELIEFKKKLLYNFDKISKSDLEILEKEKTILNVVLNPTFDKFLSIELESFKSISTWLILGLLAKAFNMQDIAKKYFSQMIPFEINQLNLAIRLDDPSNIKKCLYGLLPSCNRSCEVCKYQRECNYYITKDLQQKIAESFPNYFRLTKRYNQF